MSRSIGGNPEIPSGTEDAESAIDDERARQDQERREEEEGLQQDLDDARKYGTPDEIDAILTIANNNGFDLD